MQENFELLTTAFDFTKVYKFRHIFQKLAAHPTEATW